MSRIFTHLGANRCSVLIFCNKYLIGKDTFTVVQLLNRMYPFRYEAKHIQRRYGKNSKELTFFTG